MAKGSRGTGRKAHGGGKSRTNKDHRKACRLITKHRWDDIVADQLLPENMDKAIAEATELDPDKPGLGQFHCLSCRRPTDLPHCTSRHLHPLHRSNANAPHLRSKYFINSAALASHSATSKHKRRLKMLKTTKPYSHEEARAGAGCGPSDHGFDLKTKERHTTMDTT